MTGPAKQAPYACLAWVVEDGAGRWILYLALSDLSRMSLIAVSWPGRSGPPSLLERYDALATLGYAVTEGGPNAWLWHEGLDDQGNAVVIAYTTVRPLRREELPA
ncbi:DUF6303 family protein [Streptomyces sennicomposti]